ncbi:MAG: thymidylate synthase [Lachnospiraceae bacterium]|nr:thymidylate synthase [Lachnospiraceae bacterium]
MDTLNDRSYLAGLKYVMKYGIKSDDRTGTGTIRYSGLQSRYYPAKGYPLLTTKKVLFYPMLIELLWFLQGRNDLQWLQDRKCNIWNSWHHEDGSIGPGYGVQWRRWPKGAIHCVDQIKEVIESIKSNPNSRRHIVNAWNVSQIDEMALPPCHFNFQFNVINETLDLVLTQRSGDMFLGVNR